MSKLSQEYIKEILKPAVEKYLIKKKNLPFSYKNVEVVFGADKSTIGRLFKDGEMSEKLHKEMYGELNIETQEEWKKVNEQQSWIIENFVKHNWLSYRFNSKRQLYISSWIFTGNNDVLEVWKKTPKGYNFHGELTFDRNLCLSGKLVCSSLILSYQTYFPDVTLNNTYNYNDNFPDKDIHKSFHSVIWDVVVKHGDEVYSTTEVLYKIPDSNPGKHMKDHIKEKADSLISYAPDADFQPSNIEYLAYNFLTRYNAKTRVLISNRDFDLNKNLYYQHTIRIGCPVRSISNQREFERVLQVTKNIKEVLINTFKFKQENIFLELESYKTYDELHKQAVYLFERTKSINHTHFLAIIPKLRKNSMGIFAEIFYRIGKKLPVVVFYEDVTSLSYVLNNLIENRHIVNTALYHRPIETIPQILAKNPEMLFAFRLP